MVPFIGWLAQEPLEPPDPGLSPPVPHGVVGGEPAAEGAWPDAVAILSVVGDQFACSGVLIAPDIVLTAGHCLGAAPGTVVVGTNRVGDGGIAVEIVDQVQYEDFLDTLDVALLFLAEPITEVAPRKLAVDCFATRILDGAPVAIVGFGATDRFASDFEDTLYEARSTVADADCSSLSAGCNPEVSPGGELIAGGDGVDSCSGDSGGPLYLLGDDETTLAGITSRGIIGSQYPCGDGGIYVRADAIDAWLLDLGITLDRPFCEGNQPPFPTAGPIAVEQGLVGATLVSAHDANPDQTHVFEIVAAPEIGRVLLDDGLVVYLAPDRPAQTSVTVRVTDDGDPPLTGEIVIPITVTPPDLPLDVGCGCAGGASAPGGLAAALVVWLTSRRSRCRPG